MSDINNWYSLWNKYYNEKNDAEAAIWYRKSAEQGDALAQCFIGICYIEGCGVERDINAAKYWLNKSAAQGVK